MKWINIDHWKFHKEWEQKQLEEMSKEKINITLKHWHSQCGDHCCDWYGTYIYVNGNRIDREYDGDDTVSIVEDLLKHLGHEVEVEETYEGDDEYTS